MNTKNTTTIAGRSLIAGVACVLLGILFSVKSEVSSRNSLTNDETNTIINKIDEAFDLAEQKVLKIEPIPDDEPSKPDPDVNKCVCKGTGVITHGDGHTTDCPYHKREVASKNMECIRPRRIFNFFR
jgi:hypothetical protein